MKKAALQRLFCFQQGITYRLVLEQQLEQQEQLEQHQ